MRRGDVLKRSGNTDGKEGTIMTTTKKIIGTVLIGASAIVLCIGVLIVAGISALGGWLADMIGATGSAHLGITLLTYILMLGVLAAFVIMTMVLIVKGIKNIKE